MSAEFSILNHTDEENEAHIAKYKAAGFEVVFPAPNELQLDIDNNDDYAMIFYKMHKFNSMCAPWQVELIEKRPSASGLPHRHIVLRLLHKDGPIEATLPVIARIALQMFFGSDSFRELHNFCRYLMECEHPIMFIEGGKWSDV